MQETNETFTYTYSAQQQEELRRLRDRYLPPAETPLDQLRRLERGVTRKGTLVSVAVGTAGALLLGLGMCCTMVWSGLFVPGVAVGLAGIVAMAAALPLYNRVTRRERQKLAPLVRELTREPGSPQAGC